MATKAKTSPLDAATAAAKDCPWKGTDARTADYLAAAVAGDSEVLEQHKVAANMGKRYGGYLSARNTLQTDAKLAGRRLHEEVISGTISADEFLTLAREAVQAKVIADDVGRVVFNLPTPAWYQKPQDELNEAVSSRRLRTAKWADQLLTDARVAVADKKATANVVLVVKERPVSLGVIARWAEPLHRMRSDRQKLVTSGPRINETEAEFSDRIAGQVNQLTQLLDTDDDLLAAKS